MNQETKKMRISNRAIIKKQKKEKLLKNKMGEKEYRDLELKIIQKFENNKTSYRNIGFVDNLHEYVCASDLVVSLAGRSTIDESLVYGTPGIFIPIKDHFEQEQNAKKLGYSYDDISRLQTLIEEKLELGRTNRADVKNGAKKAAKIITEMV